jgi:hypothetical protein
MANYKGIILTLKGRALLAKAQTGALLQFTRAKIGDGEIGQGESLDNLNDLVTPRLNLEITNLQALSNGTCKIRTHITNEGVTQGFFIKEYGLFANDPDTNEEILYAITTATEPDYLPADGTATIVNNQFDVNILVGNATNISASVNPNGLTNQQDFEDHIYKNDLETHTEGIRIIDQTQVPYGNEGTLTQIIDWYAHQIRAITGEQNWYDEPISNIDELYKMLQKLMLQLEVDGRAPGNAGSFLDDLAGSIKNMTYLNAAADLTAAVSAGATNLAIDMVNGSFTPNTLVTISDDVNREEVFVSAANETSLTVSALTKAYKKGARISRSDVVLDALNKKMKIGEWVTYTISVSEVI